MKKQIQELHVGQLAIVLSVVVLVGLALVAAGPVVGGRYTDKCTANVLEHVPRQHMDLEADTASLPDSISEESLREWVWSPEADRTSADPTASMRSAGTWSCNRTGRSISNLWSITWLVLALVAIMTVLWIWFGGRKAHAEE